VAAEYEPPGFPESGLTAIQYLEPRDFRLMVVIIWRCLSLVASTSTNPRIHLSSLGAARRACRGVSSLISDKKCPHALAVVGGVVTPSVAEQLDEQQPSTTLGIDLGLLNGLRRFVKRVCDLDHGTGEVGPDEKGDRLDSTESCRAITLAGLDGVGDQLARDDLGVTEELP
jgi:hypothetical protein